MEIRVNIDWPWSSYITIRRLNLRLGHRGQLMFRTTPMLVRISYFESSKV